MKGTNLLAFSEKGGATIVETTRIERFVFRLTYLDSCERSRSSAEERERWDKS